MPKQVGAWGRLWPYGKPVLEDASGRTCGPRREKPRLKHVCCQDLWPHRGPLLEQSVPKGLYPVVGTRAGAVGSWVALRGKDSCCGSWRRIISHGRDAMLRQGESCFSLSYSDMICYKLNWLASQDCFAHDSNWWGMILSLPWPKSLSLYFLCSLQLRSRSDGNVFGGHLMSSQGQPTTKLQLLHEISEITRTASNLIVENIWLFPDKAFQVIANKVCSSDSKFKKCQGSI